MHEVVERDLGSSREMLVEQVHMPTSFTAQPEVSILLINWNGRRLLEEYLPSVVANLSPSVEAIVLDCASTDDSLPFVRDNFPQVGVIRFREDPYPDLAYNYGVRFARGRYIVLLNNDVKLDADVVERLLDVETQHPDTIVVPTEMTMTGEVVSEPVCYPYAIPLYVFSKLFRRSPGATRGGPFLAHIACALFPKRLLLEVPANEHLGFYEELEWFWRFKLRGVRIIQPDDIRIHHAGAATVGGSSKSAYFRGRNAIAAHFICLRLPSFILFIPVWMAYSVWRSFRYLLALRPRLLIAFWRGILSFVRDMRLFWGDRATVQRSRLLGDVEILREMIRSCEYAHARSGLTLFRWIRRVFSESG